MRCWGVHRPLSIIGESRVKTFYQPSAEKVMRRWRECMPAGFEFTIKAWQLITHAASSPTYRRLKRPLTARERAEAGAFRDTTIVQEG